jgi:uncharacterized membrane protein
MKRRLTNVRFPPVADIRAPPIWVGMGGEWASVLFVLALVAIAGAVVATVRHGSFDHAFLTFSRIDRPAEFWLALSVATGAAVALVLILLV